MTSPVTLPGSFVSRQRRSSEGRTWLEGVQQNIQELCEEWGLKVILSPGEPAWSGFTAVVLPVLTDLGQNAALKLSVPGEETDSEGPALRIWNGTGAVGLLNEDPQRSALLLERLDPQRTLNELPLQQTIPIWGSLMEELSVPVPPADPAYRQIPHLADLAERWCDELPQDWSELGEPFPRWLMEAALETCQSHGQVGRRDFREVLVHADLHFLNIIPTLAEQQDATRWLAIDPQAVIGQPEYAVAPVLRNKIREYSVLDPQADVSVRLREFCEAAGLDVELARAWAVTHFVENALWYLRRSGHDGDAQRSLWLASALLGRSHELDINPARLSDPGTPSGFHGS